MPWHTDPCRRFSVVVRGEWLRIGLREDGEQVMLAVHPGIADWDEPEPRPHRGVSVDGTADEEVVMFFLDAYVMANVRTAWIN